MNYKKPMPTKPFRHSTILLLAFLVAVCMNANGCGCGCGNTNQPKPEHVHQGSIGIEVTPPALQGDQRTITVTFVPKTSGKSKKSLSLASYQLQVSFPGNAQVYYTSSKQIDQALQSQEKIKLEKLLSTQQINTSQAIALTIVPSLHLRSLEMELTLLDTEDQVIQKIPVRWQQDRSLSTIRIELGHNPVNNRVIYALENEGERIFKDIRLRYTNISTDEEGKRVLLDNQLSSTLPIPELAAGGRTENKFIAIDFKNAPQATFRFEVIDSQNQILATREEVFNKNNPAPGSNNSTFQEISKELKKGKDHIDMDKIKELLDQPGIDLNQLTKEEDDTYSSPITLVSRAVQQGNLEMVKLLINKGAHVDTRAPGGVSALEVAAEHADQEMVKTLIAAGADVNGSPTNGFGPVHLAGRYRNVAMLEELLKSDRLDINKQDSSGRTALHFLVSAIERSVVIDNDENKKKQLLAITKDMIDKGADANKESISGDTPLHWASNFLNEGFDLLLNAPNIEVNAQNEHGHTPLHNLVDRYLHTKDPVALPTLSQNISLLIQGGANIHLKSKAWEDPARTRYSYENNEAEQIAKDQAGKSALEWAEEAGKVDLIKLLKGEVV